MCSIIARDGTGRRIGAGQRGPPDLREVRSAQRRQTVKLTTGPGLGKPAVTSYSPLCNHLVVARGSHLSEAFSRNFRASNRASTLLFGIRNDT